MDIRQFAVKTTARLALKTAKGDPMLGSDGKELAVLLYGPASKQFAQAQHDQKTRLMERARTKGDAELTVDQVRMQDAEFLAQCTHSFENVELDKLTGDELAKAIYAMPEIGFVAEQVNKFLGGWANFLPAPTKS